MLQQKITELTTIIDEKTKKETKLNKKIEVQKASIKEWQQNSKNVYKDLKRNQILQEKERYEMLVQIKQLKAKVTEQKTELKDYDKQLKKF